MWKKKQILLATHFSHFLLEKVHKIPSLDLFLQLTHHQKCSINNNEYGITNCGNVCKPAPSHCFSSPLPLPLRTFLGFQHIIPVNSRHGSNRPITIGHIVLNTNCAQVYAVTCMWWQLAPRTIESKLNKITAKSYIPFHERLMSVCVCVYLTLQKHNVSLAVCFGYVFLANEQSLIHV